MSSRDTVATIGHVGAEATASVLTLVRGRRRHLRFLIEGLCRQLRPPKELVIAWMEDPKPQDLPPTAFPLRHLAIEGEDLPLAAARNRAAEAADAELLVFLDVDCIPSPGLVGGFLKAADHHDGLFLGEVLYLPGGVLDEGLDFDRLDRIGVPHPSKPAMPSSGVRREPDHGELWGLSFAIRRSLWRSLGGMDERFTGYGGEETDFGARLAKVGVPVFWTAGARAYHQHHVVYVPPLNHFRSILRNAERFYASHGRWCMDYWLGQLTDAGFIAWEPERTGIEILRYPTTADIEAARQPEERRFS